MEQPNPMQWFQQMLADFAAHVHTAKRIQSPNADDDIYVKLAVVGFSLNRDSHEWCITHFQYIRDNYDAGYSEQVSPLYGPEREAEAMFACLCMGLLLGMHGAGKIDDRVFLWGEMLLPGFILSKGSEIADALRAN
jgi:hypothetical protein